MKSQPLPTRLSLHQLADLVGLSRETIRRRLAAAGVDAVREGSSHRFVATAAINAIFQPEGAANLTEARKKESEARTSKLDVEREVIEGQRIPIEKVIEAFRNLGGRFRSIIRASKLTPDEKNECVRELYEASMAVADELDGGSK